MNKRCFSIYLHLRWLLATMCCSFQSVSFEFILNLFLNILSFLCYCKLNCFLHFISDFPLQVYLNIIYFLYVDFMSCILADLLYYFQQSFNGFLRNFFICKIMSYMNKHDFTSPFPILMHFISFSDSITLARTSSKMSIRWQERQHCLILDLRAKPFSLLMLNMRLAVSFSQMSFISSWKFSCIPNKKCCLLFI